jgi:hypothetical protein
VRRTGQPVINHPLGRQPAAPGEVLAEDWAACTRARGAPAEGAVGEVLASHHVRRVTAGGPDEAKVDSQRSQPVALTDGVHGAEERGLVAAQASSLSRCRR